jgi:hypothetical protein
VVMKDTGSENVDWFHRLVLVNVVMNFGLFHKRREIS